MAKVSRRKLIGAAAAAPLALQFGAQENPRKSIDPIIAQAAAWISEHERRDALIVCKHYLHCFSAPCQTTSICADDGVARRGMPVRCPGQLA